LNLRYKITEVNLVNQIYHLQKQQGLAVDFGITNEKLRQLSIGGRKKQVIMGKQKVTPETREALNEVYAFLIQRSMERKVAAKANASEKSSSSSTNQVQMKTDQ
jgi:hypothetical protein